MAYKDKRTKHMDVSEQALEDFLFGLDNHIEWFCSISSADALEAAHRRTQLGSDLTNQSVFFLNEVLDLLSIIRSFWRSCKKVLSCNQDSDAGDEKRLIRIVKALLEGCGSTFIELKDAFCPGVVLVVGNQVCKLSFLSGRRTNEQIYLDKVLRPKSWVFMTGGSEESHLDSASRGLQSLVNKTNY